MQDHQHRHPRRRTSKRQRTGENREVPITVLVEEMGKHTSALDTKLEEVGQ